MVREFRRRFLLLCAPAFFAGGALSLGLGGWRAALAFAVMFLLVGADFLWMAYGVGKILGDGEPPKRGSVRLVSGFLLRTLLLLLGIYGIIRFLPGSLLGITLGIGGPLFALACAGAFRTRGN